MEAHMPGIHGILILSTMDIIHGPGILLTIMAVGTGRITMDRTIHIITARTGTTITIITGIIIIIIRIIMPT
jgi:uncharacterized membrane protein YccC